jgi:hypothetical protein
MDSETYNRVVYPKVKVTNHIQFMHGNKETRFDHLEVELPEILPYSTISLEELKKIRNSFEISYIHWVKQRFVTNFFELRPSELYLARLEERCAEHFNLMSILHCYTESIERLQDYKKSKKLRYRRNKRERENKTKENFNLREEEDLSRSFYCVTLTQETDADMQSEIDRLNRLERREEIRRVMQDVDVGLAYNKSKRVIDNLDHAKRLTERLIQREEIDFDEVG